MGIKQQVIELSDEKPKNADKAVKPKRFEALNGVLAASSCYNCDCQCDGYGWADSKVRTQLELNSATYQVEQQTLVETSNSLNIEKILLMDGRNFILMKHAVHPHEVNAFN